MLLLREVKPGTCTPKKCEAYKATGVPSMDLKHVLLKVLRDPRIFSEDACAGEL
jgi:hypothetical protein